MSGSSPERSGALSDLNEILISEDQNFACWEPSILEQYHSEFLPFLLVKMQMKGEIAALDLEPFLLITTYLPPSFTHVLLRYCSYRYCSKHHLIIRGRVELPVP